MFYWKVQSENFKLLLLNNNKISGKYISTDVTKSMLNKNKIKIIKSLGAKKERTEYGLFIAEGEKIVSELLNSKLIVDSVYCTKEWHEKSRFLLNKVKEVEIVGQDDLLRISFLKTPQPVICLVRLPHYRLQMNELKDKLTIVLDDVQDPGNVGTIVRIADWFGIENVICSTETADAFNPKVVQATMGAISRIKIHYAPLENIFKEARQYKIPLYGTTLEGENIYSEQLSSNGMIVMGNESKGLNPAWQTLLNKQLFIPFFPADKKRSESLNVAIATSIVCSEFRRRDF